MTTSPTPRVVALALPLLFAGLLAPPAGAEVLEVNSTADLPDADLGDGVCDADLLTEGLQITLRAAIQHANATLGPDEIVLPAGTYKLTRKGGGEDAADVGDLDVLEDLTLTGASRTTTIIDGKKAKDRVFQIFPGAAVMLSGVTIQKGKTPDDSSGGGGIYTEGELTLVDSVITRCKSLEDAGGLDVQGGLTTLVDVEVSRNKSSDDGGGIDIDSGNLVIENCTISQNKAKDEGGGLENSSAFVEIRNSTFSKNKSKEDGAAIVNEDAGTMTLQNVTLTGNKSKGDQGISVEALVGPLRGGSLTQVRNSILHGKSKKKKVCSGDGIFSLGGNLDSGTGCDLVGVQDLNATDPRLDKKLADNGGPTLTHALLEGSPCIDAAIDDGAPKTDQRGLPRVDLDGVGVTSTDIGAFEVQAR